VRADLAKVQNCARDIPVPGGPYNKIPFTCIMPIFSMSPGEKRRDANAFLKMAWNSLSRPPIPISENLKLFYFMLADRIEHSEAAYSGATILVPADRVIEAFRLIGVFPSL
jgi:hypothetical protein